MNRFLNQSPNLRASKRMMIFLLKMKEENEILEKAGNQVQEKTKLRSIILKPAELISNCHKIDYADFS